MFIMSVYIMFIYCTMQHCYCHEGHRGEILYPSAARAPLHTHTHKHNNELSPQYWAEPQ